MGRVARTFGSGIVAAAAAASLTGCLGGIGGDSDSAGSAGGSAGDDGRSVAAATAPTANPNKPIVKATFESPITPGAKVDIAILELKVTGQLAQLTLAITPHVVGGDGNPSVYGLNGDQSPDVTLIDPVNLKRYVVVKDSAGQELQPNYIATNLANERPNLQTYMFAAPQGDVRSVDVVFGKWPPFRNVPVSR
jgi:hypothetical protein